MFAYGEDEMGNYYHLKEILLKLLQRKRQNNSGMPKLLWNPRIIVENSIIISGSTLFHIRRGDPTCLGNSSQYNACCHLSELQKSFSSVMEYFNVFRP